MEALSYSQAITELKEVLHEINNEYGQDHPVRIYEKSLDWGNFHLEFESIFGFALYKSSTNGSYAVILISEDDDFWRINEGDTNFSAGWLESFEKISKRMNKYYKILKAL